MFKKLQGGTWLVAAMGLAISLPATAANWAQAFYSPGHTAFNPGETTLSPTNVSGLQLLWGNSSVGGATNVALVDGTLYVEGGTNNDQIAAIDAATGSTLWSVANGDGSVPAVSGIAVGSGLVHAACGLTDSGGRGYGTICAYRRANGKLAWKYSSGCNCAPEVFVSPFVLSDSTLYFGYYSGGAYGTQVFAAVDAQTGGTIWTDNTGNLGSVGPGAPAVGNGYVYFDCYLSNNDFQGICALSQSDGSLSWSLNLDSGASGLTALQNNLFVNALGESEVLALDGATGAQLWSYPYSSSPSGPDFPPALAKGVLYVLDGNNNMYALHAGSGKLIWSGASENVSTPSVANGVLYADGGAHRDTDPTVYAYSTQTGDVLWRAPTRTWTALDPPPLVANGTLYLTNAPCGTICAYGLASGTAKR